MLSSNGDNGLLWAALGEFEEKGLIFYQEILLRSVEGWGTPAGLPHCLTLDFSQSVLVRSWGMEGDPVPAGQLWSFFTNRWEKSCFLLCGI